jgi:hypothetical protein
MTSGGLQKLAVAFMGACPMPSITHRAFNLIESALHPQREVENSITEAARIVATPASTALPPL